MVRPWARIPRRLWRSASLLARDLSSGLPFLCERGLATIRSEVCSSPAPLLRAKFIDGRQARPGISISFPSLQLPIQAYPYSRDQRETFGRLPYLERQIENRSRLTNLIVV